MENFLPLQALDPPPGAPSATPSATPETLQPCREASKIFFSQPVRVYGGAHLIGNACRQHIFQRPGHLSARVRTSGDAGVCLGIIQRSLDVEAYPIDQRKHLVQPLRVYACGMQAHRKT